MQICIISLRQYFRKLLLPEFRMKYSRGPQSKLYFVIFFIHSELASMSTVCIFQQQKLSSYRT